MRILLLWLLLTCVCQATPKVFIGSAPYRGPVEVDGSVVRVDLEQLAATVGWVVDHDQAVWHLHRPSEASSGQEPGLYVGVRHFDGAVREDGPHLWVPIVELARFMGGRATFDESIQLVQCSIPGMPYTDTQASLGALQSQLSLKPYTLVYFYVDSDPYCKHFGPVVNQYAARHGDRMRLVSVDLLHQGANWIYGVFKTRDNGIPEIVLVTPNGRVVQKLLGDTTVATLEKELSPLMK